MANIIKSTDIVFIRPPLNDCIVEFNDLLATVLKNNYPSFKYIASATINRLEAQTHLYEKVEKYLQVGEFLKKNKDADVQCIGDDVFFFDMLRKEFGDRVKVSETETGFSSRIKEYYNFTIRMLRTGKNYIRTSFIFPFFFPPSRKSYDYVIRSYCDYRNYADNFREEYFGLLPEELGSENNVLIVYTLVHRTIKEAYKFSQKSSSAKNFEARLTDSLLTPWTIIKSMFLFLFSHIELKEKIVFKGCDITALIQKSLDEDYQNTGALHVYFEREIAKKILKMTRKRVMFPYENQTWEKVYPFLREKLGFKASILGYQHTGVSFKLMQYFPSRIEKHLPLFPDKIVTVGKIIADLLREKANYPCPIVPGAALRHQKIMKDGKVYVKSASTTVHRNIAYAFSYDIRNYPPIIRTLNDVFGNSEIKVYLKFHPDYKQENILKDLSFGIANNLIPASTIPWEDVYADIDLVLYSDNSIGLEGMANGCKTLHVDIDEPILHAERLFYFDLWKPSISDKELFRLKEEIVNGIFDKTFPTEKVSEYLNNYFIAYRKEHISIFKD